MKLNKEWHEKNPMPRNATVDQRIRWHAEHARECACRPIPDKLRAEMEKRTAAPQPSGAVAGVELAGLWAREPKVKYGAARQLISLAESRPDAVYPEFDVFVKLLDSSNNILRWSAIDIIGFLARVDTGKKVDELVPRLIGMLNRGNLITANHAISALSEIALAKPEHRREITAALLKVENYKYQNGECLNIACGRVMLGISKYFKFLNDRQAVLDFARRQLTSTRPATKRKAEAFLKQAGKAAT